MVEHEMRINLFQYDPKLCPSSNHPLLWPANALNLLIVPPMYIYVLGNLFTLIYTDWDFSLKFLGKGLVKVRGAASLLRTYAKVPYERERGK